MRRVPALTSPGSARHATEAPIDSGGFVSGNLLASYLHIHFGQCTDIAADLSKNSCRGIRSDSLRARASSPRVSFQSKRGSRQS